MSEHASHVDARGMFPMRVVTRTTGLTADLVRAWERRYRAIAPSRTIGKARRYSQSDIARLELLRDVVAEGHTISSVAHLDEQTLHELRKSAQKVERAETGTDAVEAYLAALARFDLGKAEALLARACQLVGPREAALTLIAPLMRTVGDKWHDGRISIAEEHAATGQVRAVLSTLLRTAAVHENAPRIVVATPPTHRHEVGALVASVLAAEQGVRAIYLGSDVPWKQLGAARKAARAELIVLSVPFVRPAPGQREEQKQLQLLSREHEVWIGAPSEYTLNESKNLRALHSFEAFDMALGDRFRR